MARNNEQAIVEIILRGQQPNATLRDLERSARALRAQLSRLPVDSQEFANRSRDLAQINTRLRSIRQDLMGLGGLFQSIGREIKALGIIGAAMLAFTFIQSKISSMVKSNAELSDSLADIRKTTGMTVSEVETLNTALSQINTRTSTKELRNIAIAAGQLGIAKEDILKFTAATDKMNVALGDEFNGGAEEVTKAMGGLRNVFTDIKTDKADEDMLHIGNAINELASQGAATGPVVADFANRIGGVGITLGLTSGQVLGLSATLQELQVSTERGGTAVVKILQKMTQNTGDFAKVAGMPVKEFTNLVNTDLFAAFSKVAEGSKKAGVTATSFGKILDSLGVDGAGASEVFAKLGNNTALLNEKVLLANTSLKGTDSIMAEFKTKNATLGAEMDRLTKSMASAFTNSKISDGLKYMVSALGDFFDKTPEFQKLGDAWKEQKSVVDNLTSSMEPLLHRHDELKGKSSLSKVEQEELNAIIAKVADTIPFAVTEFDKYGKAMDINTAKGRDFIAMESEKLEVLNKDALKAYREELIKVTEVVSVYQKALSNRDAEGDLFKVVTLQTKFGKEAEFTTKNVKLTNEEILNLNKGLQATRDKQLGIAGAIFELTGKTFQANKKVVEDKKKTSDESIAIDEAEAKRRLELHKKLLDDIAKLEQEHRLAKMQKDARDLEEIRIKYDELRKRAAGNSKDLARIKQLELDDIMDLEMKQFQESASAETKAYYEKLDRLRKLEAEKKKLETGGPDNRKGMSKAQIEAEETRLLLEQWNDQIEAAKRHNESLLQGEEVYSIDVQKLTELRNAAVDALNKAHNEKTEKESAKALKQAIRAYERYSQEASQLIQTFQEGQRLMDEKALRDSQKTADAEIAKEKELLDKKVISQQQYEKKVAAIENEKAKRDLKLKQEAAAREKKYAMFQIIISTAIAVAKYIANTDYIGAIAAGALGAAQLAVASSQPVPEYAKGGLHKSDDPQGYVTQATHFTNSASGRDFIAGEAGAEYIVPNWMLQEPATANVVNALETIRQRGYATGGLTSELPGTNSSVSANQDIPFGNQNTSVDPKLYEVLNTLAGILQGGIKAKLSYDEFNKSMGEIESAKNSARV